MLTHDTFPRRHLVAAMVAVASLGAAAVSQERFPRPEDAMQALVDAARAHDQAKLVAVLGPGSEDVVSSGDPVDDRAAAARFVAAATRARSARSSPPRRSRDTRCAMLAPTRSRTTGISTGS